VRACCWGRNKWRTLIERAHGGLRLSLRLHRRCEAPPTPRATCKRLSRKQGARPSWSISASARSAATSTLRAARVAAHHSDSAHFLGSADPGEAVVAIGQAFARFVSTRGDIDAMLGIPATDGLIALLIISTAPSLSMRWCKIPRDRRLNRSSITTTSRMRP
jgi:hypothetical protein